jgi:hypothetical protein|tara:strand:- start:1741 stop:2403 length:663 start_codon:yes stop_codon:yes gene_type:complete
VAKTLFDFTKKFEYENGFYLTSDITRIGKLLSQYELYKKTVNLPGDIIECGVFKGASLIRLASFRDLLESTYSRKIIGFDTFEKLPSTNYYDDIQVLNKFIDEAGDKCISIEELTRTLHRKGLKNIELIKGDINITIPEYVKKCPSLKIALLHIDTDVYEPAVTILEYLYEKIVREGIIMFDDYGTFPGETKAVDEFFKNKNVVIRKLSLNYIPSYVIKE